jgi:hypothetical protein
MSSTLEHIRIIEYDQQAILRKTRFLEFYLSSHQHVVEQCLLVVTYVLRTLLVTPCERGLPLLTIDICACR